MIRSSVLPALLVLSVAPAALAQPPGEPAPAAPAEETPAKPAEEAAPKPEEAAQSAPADEKSGPPAPPPSPLEISVVGTRVQQTSGSAHVVTPKQLQRFKHDDPHKVFLSVPGVYIRGEDGFGLRPNIGIRGALSDRSKKITLMEDGVLFGPAPYSAPAAYYFPLIGRMDSVRVVKGPSAVSFGPHTIGGAIDLITAAIPSERRGMIDLSTGQFMHRKLHFRQALADDNYGVLVEVAHLGTDGFKELDGGGNTGFSRTELMLKGRYVFDPTAKVVNELEIKAGYGGEDSNETYLGLTDEDFRENPYRRYGASRLDHMEWNRTQLQLTHRARFGRKLDITTTLYRHDLHRIWRKVNGFRGAAISSVLANPEDPRAAVFYGVLTGQIAPSTPEETLLIGPNDRKFVSQGLQSTISYRPRTGPVRHRIEYGVRIHYDSIRRLHTQDGFLVEGNELVPEERFTQTTADNDASTWALSMHASDAATWGPLTVTVGARMESIRSEMDDRFEGTQTITVQQVIVPGAGVFVALPRDLGLFAGVHQGFSPVPPGQTVPVRPEKSVNYEAGMRWSPRRFRAEIIGFYNDYKNLTNICTFSTGCVEENLDQQSDGGAARVLGVEAYAESELKVRENLAIPGRFSYTFTDARFSTDFQSADPIFGNVRAGDELPYVPRHQLSASVGVEMPRWGANLSGTYVSAMRESAGQGEPAPGTATDAYFLLDASVNVRVLRWLSVYGLGRNLLDDAYIASRRPYGARPGAPRWLMIGAKADF
ncbi:TonB-dependent receptor family protein [Polyangium aurulentum]|uniref:TonB-dependent receptor family protein n=1 Tax=Polyangium aurulentum TaxID=2567896 RepID=UPI001F3669E0|nr:TonB-dependent receptor [Polyangium aurulentum]